MICSGYSSGAVVIWEGDGASGTSYRELITTTDSQGQRPQVASTAIYNTLCAAGFDNGTLIFGLDNIYFTTSWVIDFSREMSIRGECLKF